MHQMPIAPDAYAPDAYAPDAYAPDAYAPDAYAPDAYAPDAYAPDAYSPDAYAPDAYAPDLAYTSAQMRSLIGVSAFEGLADETISSTPGTTAVTFMSGCAVATASLTRSRPLIWRLSKPSASVRVLHPTLPPTSLTPVAGDYHTLILMDRDRMDTADPLSGYPGEQPREPLHSGRRLWAWSSMSVRTRLSPRPTEGRYFTACPIAKNRVAEAIKRIVDGYWTLNPDLEYIVIIGNDDVIPFFRHPDRAQLANEKNYQPPVSNKTTSFANLILGYVLSQDAYGSRINLSLSNTTLPVPNLPVGRWLRHRQTF